MNAIEIIIKDKIIEGLDNEFEFERFVILDSETASFMETDKTIRVRRYDPEKKNYYSMMTAVTSVDDMINAINQAWADRDKKSIDTDKKLQEIGLMTG